MRKKVSILMTTYNDGGRFLNKSILGILNQTYSNFEFVIVNDGSLDNTSRVVQDFAKNDKRIKFLDRLENKGRRYSLNEGLALCVGDFVFINDADDISNKYRIESCIKFYEEVKNKKRFGLVGTAFLLNDISKGISKIHYLKTGLIQKSKIPMWRIFLDMPFPHSSVMYSKNALIEVGGFSTEVTSCIDYFTLTKIAKDYDIYGINKPLVERIIDGNNFFMQSNISKDYEKNINIINKWQNDNIRFKAIYRIPKIIHEYKKRLLNRT